MNNFLLGLLILAISILMLFKSDVLADLMSPDFMTKSLGVSSREAYQIIGILTFIFSLLVIFRFLPLLG